MIDDFERIITILQDCEKTLDDSANEVGFTDEVIEYIKLLRHNNMVNEMIINKQVARIYELEMKVEGKK